MEHCPSHETVYVDRHQRVLEGTTSNIFFVKGDTLVTAGTDILPGITRQVILDLVRDRFQVELRDIDRSELDRVDEAFLTASNKEVVPVTRLDDRVIDEGVPGEKTREIMRLFKEYTAAFGRADVS